MSVDIRRLSLDDIHLLKEIFEFNQFVEAGFVNCYLTTEHYQTYGYFENGKLLEVLSIIESYETPSWIVSTVFSKYFLFFDELIDYVIAIEEKNKRYQFFTLNEDREFSIRNNRYKKYLEEIVFAGTFSRHLNLNRDVLEYQKCNKDSFIHFWVLKNEYRSFQK